MCALRWQDLTAPGWLDRTATTGYGMRAARRNRYPSSWAPERSAMTTADLHREAGWRRSRRCDARSRIPGESSSRQDRRCGRSDPPVRRPGDRQRRRQAAVCGRVNRAALPAGRGDGRRGVQPGLGGGAQLRRSANVLSGPVASIAVSFRSPFGTRVATAIYAAPAPARALAASGR
jgi:hypothetical protein